MGRSFKQSLVLLPHSLLGDAGVLEASCRLGCAVEGVLCVNMPAGASPTQHAAALADALLAADAQERSWQQAVGLPQFFLLACQPSGSSKTACRTAARGLTCVAPRWPGLHACPLAQRAEVVESCECVNHCLLALPQVRGPAEADDLRTMGSLRHICTQRPEDVAANAGIDVRSAQGLAAFFASTPDRRAAAPGAAFQAL